MPPTNVRSPIPAWPAIVENLGVGFPILDPEPSDVCEPCVVSKARLGTLTITATVAARTGEIVVTGTVTALPARIAACVMESSIVQHKPRTIIWTVIVTSRTVVGYRVIISTAWSGGTCSSSAEPSIGGCLPRLGSFLRYLSTGFLRSRLVEFSQSRVAVHRNVYLQHVAGAFGGCRLHNLVLVSDSFPSHLNDVFREAVPSRSLRVEGLGFVRTSLYLRF